MDIKLLQLTEVRPDISVHLEPDKSSKALSHPHCILQRLPEEPKEEIRRVDAQERRQRGANDERELHCKCRFRLSQNSKTLKI